jgi:hypothetical protein
MILKRLNIKGGRGATKANAPPQSNGGGGSSELGGANRNHSSDEWHKTEAFLYQEFGLEKCVIKALGSSDHSWW